MIAGERARESECNHSYTLGWNFNLYVDTRFVGTDPMRSPMQHGRVMQRLYLPVTRISNRAHFQPFAFRIRMASIDSGKARFNRRKSCPEVDQHSLAYDFVLGYA